jgi:membrane-associated phospholipid phosphatase
MHRLLIAISFSAGSFLSSGLCAEPSADVNAGSVGSVPRADSIFSTDYVKQLWFDTGAVLTAPAHWDEADWQIAGIWTGGVAVSAGLDHEVRRQAQTHWRSRPADRFFRQWQNLGMQYSWIEIAAFEAWGVADDNRVARDTAMDALSASVIAGGIITPTLKYAVGRYRPAETEQTFKFRPFSGHQSFPSGHATQAFAIATVVASHYTEWWQQSLSYGAAALVDVARIQQNAHFLSDVVAGSAIGWSVGRAIVHRHGTGSYAVEPWFGRGSGLMVTHSF